MFGFDYKHQEWNADARSGQLNYYGSRRMVPKTLICLNLTNGNKNNAAFLYISGGCDAVIDLFYQ